MRTCFSDWMHWMIGLGVLGLIDFQGALAQEYEPLRRDDGSTWSTEEIETDRDSFTPATSLVGHRRWIVESAYTFIDNRRVYETHSLPELLVRYGVTERLEWRFGTNYEIGGAGNPVSGNIPDVLPDEPMLEEETTISYGIKYGVTNQSGWMPKSAILVSGFTPVAGEATGTDLSVAYLGGWTFANRWVLDQAIRYNTGSFEEDDFNIWAPSTVLKVPVGERWKAHIEYFGIFSDGRERETVQHFISPGAHYLFTRNLELGSRFGWGLSDDSPNFFINIGGGIRF
ncbi:MAG: transporter [Planctomycetota bacterium]